MPKYLFEARYTSEGDKGVEKEGGTSRREAVKNHLDQLGGKLEAMYSPSATSTATRSLTFPTT
jgi:uncharacterized protein with GYD domain